MLTQSVADLLAVIHPKGSSCPSSTTHTRLSPSAVRRESTRCSFVPTGSMQTARDDISKRFRTSGDAQTTVSYTHLTLPTICSV